MNDLKVSLNLDYNKSVPVSFIIHTRNNFQNIPNIIQNIFTSVYNPLEIVLSNDRSNNKEYFNQIIEKYKFIKLLNNEKLLSNSINDSLDLCENNWIFYIDSNFYPNNSAWFGGLMSSIQKLKKQNVKLISPLIKSHTFFNNYKSIKEDTILAEHFLPFNIVLFHKDLFRTIGKIEQNDNIIEISQMIYHKMEKRNFKQAISPRSLFI